VTTTRKAGDHPMYKVVINDEEQYSIWLADRTDPPGWRDVGVAGSKEECLAHIEKVWTDMRPLSLRRRMAGSGGSEPLGN
jgi:MbtH protein